MADNKATSQNNRAKVPHVDILKSGPKYKARTNISFGTAGEVRHGQVFQLADDEIADRLMADGTITDQIDPSPAEKSKAEQEEATRKAEEARLKAVNDRHDPNANPGPANTNPSLPEGVPPGKPASGTIPNNR